MVIFAIAVLSLSLVGCSDEEIELICAVGLSECSDGCADLDRERDNCGVCGHSCGEHEVCNDARCVAFCPEGQILCGDVCVDLETSREHCGSCELQCDSGLVCSAGECAANCGPGLSNCHGECRDLQTDQRNCGDCGEVCDPGEICVQGSCEFSCANGLSECGDTCVDMESDPAHCGSCDQDCDSGEVCSMGKCSPSCGAGLEACDGACVSLEEHPHHCGGCNNSCGAGINAQARCHNEKCSFVCQVGWANCSGDVDDGCDTDLMTSTSDCGGCGNDCTAGKACINGQCEVASPGQVQGLGGDQEALLWWGYSVGATSYSVYRCSSSSFCDHEVATVSELNWLDQTGLANGDTYYYWVSARGPAGESTRVGPVEVAVEQTAAVQDLECRLVGDEVVLHWEVSDDGAAPDAFQVLGSVDEPSLSAPDDKIDVVDSTSLSARYQPGLDGEVYYAVGGLRMAQEHQWEGNLSQTVGCEPAAPTGVQVVPEGANVGVYWMADAWPGVVGDPNYRVHWRVHDDDGPLETTDITCTPGELCYASISGLADDEDYEFWVSAKNDAGTSPQPPDAGFSIVASTAPITGVLDLMFGISGWIGFEPPLTGFGLMEEMYVDSDGSQIMGLRAIGPGSSPVHTYLSRRLPDGSLDETFGDDGYYLSSTSPDLLLERIHKDDQGRFWFVGRSGLDAIAYVLDDHGEPDDSVGNNGLIEESLSSGFDFGRSIAVDSDGALYFAADYSESGDTTVALIKYSATGDQSFLFGDNGIAEYEFVGKRVEIADLKVQDDGKIIVFGHDRSASSPGGEVVLLRFDTHGTLDTDFGDAGIIQEGLTSEKEHAHELVIQDDGKLLIYGYSRDASDDLLRPFAARYDSQGQRDSGFGVDGVITGELLEDADFTPVMHRGVDGHVLFVGGASPPNSFSTAGVVVRYHDDLTIDDNFGNDGRIYLEQSGTSLSFGGVGVQPDGRIIAFGRNTASQLFLLARFK